MYLYLSSSKYLYLNTNQSIRPQPLVGSINCQRDTQNEPNTHNAECQACNAKFIWQWCRKMIQQEGLNIGLFLWLKIVMWEITLWNIASKLWGVQLPEPHPPLLIYIHTYIVHTACMEEGSRMYVVSHMSIPDEDDVSRLREWSFLRDVHRYLRNTASGEHVILCHAHRPLTVQIRRNCFTGIHINMYTQPDYITQGQVRKLW